MTGQPSVWPSSTSARAHPLQTQKLDDAEALHNRCDQLLPKSGRLNDALIKLRPVWCRHPGLRDGNRLRAGVREKRSRLPSCPTTSARRPDSGTRQNCPKNAARSPCISCCDGPTSATLVTDCRTHADQSGARFVSRLDDGHVRGDHIQACR